MNNLPRPPSFSRTSRPPPQQAAASKVDATGAIVGETEAVQALKMVNAALRDELEQAKAAAAAAASAAEEKMRLKERDVGAAKHSIEQAERQLQHLESATRIARYVRRWWPFRC